MDSSRIDQAALALKRGELVAFPTETVYGLGADAEQANAVARIFAAKGRPSDHPLIVHVASAQSIPRFVSSMPPFAQKLIDAFWPGTLTVILPRKEGVAQAAAGGQNSIGLRCPVHPMALALLHACKQVGVHGVAAPSANRFGRVSPTSAAHVRQEFSPQVLAWVLDGGACAVGIESTIVDCTRGVPVLLRPGMLTPEQLGAACGQMVYAADDALPAGQDQHVSAAPKASGTLESHYAPRAKVRLVDATEAQKALRTNPPARAVYLLPSDPMLAAHELFARLRELDDTGASEIWVSQPPPGAAWDGVRDRLVRAAA